MSVNLVFHVRIKHVEIDYHFLRERVALVFFAPARYRWSRSRVPILRWSCEL
jgi:hypothetical protein